MGKNTVKKAMQEAIETWMSLERKTAEQRKEADAYYEQTLLQMIEEAFIEHNQDKVYEKADYLIMSVGTSFEPLVLNIKLLKPKKILFLYTDKSEVILNKIVKYCELDASAYEKENVNETEPLDIYREIKKAYLKWGKPQKLYIDFTGGTKSMSAAAAMAGAVINVQLVYVGTNDYLVDFRKPNPGSETLYYISNPLAIFGDLEIEKALVLFGQYNYPAACEKLEVLKEDVPDPDIRQQLNFVYLLGRAYEHWDALEFSKAYEYMEKLNRQVRRDRMMHPKFLLMDFADTIAKQEVLLEHLNCLPGLIQEKKQMEILQNPDYIIPLMFTMYQNALVREEQEKYDMATLLLYRLLEMIEQKRLARYNLYVSKMDYSKLKYDVDQYPELKGLKDSERFDVLKTDVQDIREELFKRPANGFLPDQVSLLEGFIILQALQDPIALMKNGKHIDRLKKIRSMVFLRNNSIFAHGLGPVSVQDFSKFKDFVVSLFQEFCQIEQVNFTEYAKQMKWLNPLDSRYYSGLEEK